MSDSLQPYGLQQPIRFLCPWDFPGKNTGVGCHVYKILGWRKSSFVLFCKILWKIQTTFLANPIHEDNRSAHLNSSHLHYLLKVRVLSVFDWMTLTKVRFMVLKWHTLQAPLLDFTCVCMASQAIENTAKQKGTEDFLKPTGTSIVSLV